LPLTEGPETIEIVGAQAEGRLNSHLIHIAAEPAEFQRARRPSLRQVRHFPVGPWVTGRLIGLRPVTPTISIVSGPYVRGKLGPHMELHRFAAHAN